jgi:hypothetical protein
VRRFSRNLRSNDDRGHAAVSRPLFGTRHQPGADPLAAQRRSDDEAPDLGAHIRLHVVDDGDIDPADDRRIAAGHEDPTIALTAQVFEAMPHGCGVDRITEFAAQARDSLRVLRMNAPYVDYRNLDDPSSAILA